MKKLLDKACENAKEIIRRLVDTGLVNELEYTVTFEVFEEQAQRKGLESQL